MNKPRSGHRVEARTKIQAKTINIGHVSYDCYTAPRVKLLFVLSGSATSCESTKNRRCNLSCSLLLPRIYITCFRWFFVWFMVLCITNKCEEKKHQSKDRGRTKANQRLLSIRNMALSIAFEPFRNSRSDGWKKCVPVPRMTGRSASKSSDKCCQRSSSRGNCIVISFCNPKPWLYRCATYTTRYTAWEICKLDYQNDSAWLHTNGAKVKLVKLSMYKNENKKFQNIEVQKNWHLLTFQQKLKKEQ